MIAVGRIFLFILFCVSKTCGIFLQFNCIDIHPGVYIRGKTVKSKTCNSHIDCAVFCLDSDIIWLSASLHGKDQECHCYEEQADMTKRIADPSSTYMSLNEEGKSYKNCYEIYQCFSRGNGVYNITLSSGEQREVYCDMDLGGWITIQNRYDGKLLFNRSYMEYENGFGSVNGEHWLGLKYIHDIVSEDKYELRFDLEDWAGEKRYAVYSDFFVDGPSEFYRLNASEYSGNAGNSLAFHNGMMFSAGSVDNDNWPTKCVDRFGGGGFWYNACHNVNINGIYGDNEYGMGIIWYKWHGPDYSLKSVSMKIRPKNI